MVALAGEEDAKLRAEPYGRLLNCGSGSGSGGGGGGGGEEEVELEEKENVGTGLVRSGASTNLKEERELF